jgi:transposase
MPFCVELDFTYDAHSHINLAGRQEIMSIAIEPLFTAALGLQAPWVVSRVDLDTAKRRIDFEVSSEGSRLTCPACGAADQCIHDRVRRSWRHLDFFQFEAWLHADVPRIGCTACGKTTQVNVPWAREGSGFTLLFEALALSLCQSLPVAQAANQLRVSSKRLWRRIEHYIGLARAQDDMSTVSLIGIDETSVKRGQEYITVVHDLDAKRLLFVTPGRDHETVSAFKKDLLEHGGEAEKIQHVCMDMSAAYIKGVTKELPQAAISHDRFHVIALANEAMDKVRREEIRNRPEAVQAALGQTNRKALKDLLWGMRKDAADWSKKQHNAMHWLQGSNLQSARAWRLKEALREVYACAKQSNDPEQAEKALLAWISWARRSRLEPFKRLAQTLKEKLSGVVRGMLDGRSNAYVEAMNGLLQQTKIAARGFRTVKNFMAIAYLRMSKLKHLPANPFRPAVPRDLCVSVHRM